MHPPYLSDVCFLRLDFERLVILGPPTTASVATPATPAAAGFAEADGFACSADNLEATVSLSSEICSDHIVLQKMLWLNCVSVWHARRFSRNLVSTNHLQTLFVFLAATRYEYAAQWVTNVHRTILK